MKIVTLKDFVRLPKGTVYAQYSDFNFSDIRIKEDMVPGSDAQDFYFDELFVVDGNDIGEMMDLTKASLETGSSVPLHFHTGQRWSRFNDKQLFAVFEPADVQGLIDRLGMAQTEVLKNTPPEDPATN